jgi:DNA-binding transcriptional regulator of glucitol operon
MRYFILSTFLFFTVQLVSAQLLWEKVYSEKHRYLSYTLDGAVFSDSIILTTGVTDFLFFCKGEFVALNISGEELWNRGYVYAGKDCGHYNCLGNIRLVATTENSIYTCGESWAGDVYFGDETIFLHKFDPSGDVIFTTSYPKPVDLFQQLIHPTGIIAHDEWGIMVSAGLNGKETDRIFKFDIDGIFLWEKNYDFLIDQIVYTDSGYFALRTKSSVIIASPSGELQDTFELNQPAIDMAYLDQKLYLATSGEVFRLDIDTGKKESILLNIDENPFSLLNVFNDSLWVLSEGINMAYVINILSDGLQEYGLPLPAFSIQNFIVTNNEIVLTGSNQQGLMAAITYGRKNNHPDAFWPDIELVDFEISNTEIMYVSDAPWEGIVEGFRFDTQITIRNNSKEPIEWFWLQSDREGGFNCGRHYYYELFNDLTIEPQQEISFDIGRTADFQNPGTNTRVCYKVIAPNSRLESNVANNQICKTFDITSAPDISQQNGWGIYPNPVTSHLNVHLAGKTNLNYNIWDLSGKLMMSGFLLDEENTIDLSQLPKGMYVFQARKQFQVFTKKIIKD